MHAITVNWSFRCLNMTVVPNDYEIKYFLHCDNSKIFTAQNIKTAHALTSGVDKG